MYLCLVKRCIVCSSLTAGNVSRYDYLLLLHQLCIFFSVCICDVIVDEVGSIGPAVASFCSLHVITSGHIASIFRAK